MTAPQRDRRTILIGPYRPKIMPIAFLDETVAPTYRADTKGPILGPSGFHITGKLRCVLFRKGTCVRARIPELRIGFRNSERLLHSWPRVKTIKPPPQMRETFYTGARPNISAGPRIGHHICDCVLSRSEPTATHKTRVQNVKQTTRPLTYRFIENASSCPFGAAMCWKYIA